MKILILILALTFTDSIFSQTNSSLKKVGRGKVFQKQEKKEKKQIPLAEALVEIKNANLGVGYYKVLTDATGEFTIPDFITDIDYEITISKDGYVSYYSQNFNPNNLSYYLPKEVVVYGQVLDTKGKPVPEVEVTLSPYGYYNYAEYKVFNAITDKKGNYKFTKLNEGEFQVIFNSPKYIKETAILSKIQSGSQKKLEMILTRPAKIFGKIFIDNSESENPLKNIKVNLSGKHNHYSYSFADGSFEINDLKPETYTLTLFHRGFEDKQALKLEIKEGDELDLGKQFLSAKSPSISVFTNQYTFPSGDKVQFQLKSLRVDKYHVKLFSVTEDKFLKPPFQPKNIDPKKENLPLFKEWDEVVPNFELYEWKHNELKINEPLPIGMYIIEVSFQEKLVSSKFFTVTSLGLIAKRSPESILLYATDLITNKLIPNAKVYLLRTKQPQAIIEPPTTRIDSEQPKNIDDDKDQDQFSSNIPLDLKLLEGKTDESGIFHTKFKENDRLVAYVITENKNFAFVSIPESGNFSNENEKYFIYTDRPVYRKNQIVYFKAIAKKRASVFLPIQKEKVFFSVTKAYDTIPISSGQLELDDFGTVHSQVEIDENLELGEYRITLFSKDPKKAEDFKELGSGSFHVQEYRKPEFKISITPSKPFYINGDTLEFKVEAKYFFGAPIPKALVKYRFYETRHYETRKSYWYEEDSYTSNYKNLKQEGSKFLDDNGILVLKYDSGKYSMDREITLEMSIVDNANISLEESFTSMVGRGEFYIEINPLESFFETKKKKIFVFNSFDYSSSPVASELDVKFFRYIWKPWQRTYVRDSKPIYSTKVRTGSDGKATLTLDSELNIAGEIEVVVSSSDSKSNLIQSSYIFWNYESGIQINSDLPNLELTLNKSTLEKPDSIQILLKSKFKDIPVLLTIEGSDIHEKRVLNMTGNLIGETIQIKDFMSPNVFITATMQRGRSLYTSSKKLSIPEKDTEMNWKIESDKEKYLPRETVKLKIYSMSKLGKPTSSDFSLACVDESIFRIMEDYTPNIHSFFYSEISNRVGTLHSFPITLLAGVGKDGDGEAPVRKDFKDTAFWTANGRTNEKGYAEIEFTLPDNLTEWRLTLRGHDKEGRLGRERSKIFSSKDLIARIAKPRFLVQEDTIGFIGIVTNNSQNGITEIQSEFKVMDKKIPAKGNENFGLAARAESKETYSFNVPKNQEEVKIQFSAKAKELNDSVQYKLKTLPKGSPFQIQESGDMDKNSKISLNWENLNGFSPKQLELTLFSNLKEKFISLEKEIDNYPYDCTEQIMSKILTKVHSARMKGTEIPSEELKSNMEKIYNHQNTDGTWGFWYGDVGNEYLTAYILLGLHSIYIEKSSLDKQDDRLKNSVQKGLQAITRILSSKDKKSNDVISYLLLVQAKFQQLDNKKFQSILLSLDKKSAFENSNLLRISSIQDNSVLKKDILNNLLKNPKKDKQGLYFDSMNHSWEWQGNRTELLSNILESILESKEKSKELNQIFNSIANRIDGESSTKAIANITRAASKYIELNPINPAKSTNVQFKIGNEKLISLKSEKNSVTEKVKWNFGTEKNLDIKAETKNNDSIFQVRIKGILENPTENQNKGFQLEREILAISRTKDSNNREFLVPIPLKSNKIKTGEEILVKIKFKANENFEYIFLEDYLPSGFEVSMEDAYQKISRAYTHLERRDDRMVYYFPNLQKDRVYEIGYILRAELKGKFRLRPSRIECIYSSDLGAYSKPKLIEVE
ncbi:MAG: carboxypeptidase regulatory-like domain-containing protein [Leptospiraceae bacterium]|nr:carboxypeptidase regulatory-like domain-containing protein [Leptospiraceae bacterium]